jgi:hypothetical protein
VSGVRWELLFADLEAELAAGQAAELAAEVADRTRRELGALRLADRFRAAQDAHLQLRLLGGGQASGRLTASGPDWALLLDEQGAEHLLPLSAVASAAGLGARSERTESKVEARLDLATALRGIARRRAGVRLRLVDGSELVGTIDRVGADALDLAQHAAGEARRPGAVQGVVLVPLTSLAAVRAD